MGHQAAVAPEPGEGALDDPASPDEFEPAFLVRALDDLQRNLLSRQIGGEAVSTVAAVRKDVADEGKKASGFCDKRRSAIPVLDAGGDDFDPKQQSYRIDNRIAFDAFDLFARVVANAIPALPPFSVALTACVSMIAAVGVRAAHGACALPRSTCQPPLSDSPEGMESRGIIRTQELSGQTN